MDMALRLSDINSKTAKKTTRKAFVAFLRAYVGRPQDNIG
jgi:hypothetical protein